MVYCYLSNEKMNGLSKETRGYTAQARKAVVFSVTIYLVWVVLTYVLEGRIVTLLRPEATVDRLVYIIVANFIIGTVVALWLMRSFIDSQIITLEQMGFRSMRRVIPAVLVGGVLGFIIFAVQDPPSLNPVVLVNAFAQVLTVTIAEIVVCWCVIGTVFESVTRDRGTYVSLLVAIVTASVLFGVYHFGHSPPFNSVSMVLFLTLIGIATGLFYFIVRDIYGTIVFHNFFGVFGVMQALESSGNLTAYSQPLYPLYVSAISATIILVGLVDLLVLRKTKAP